VLLHVLYKNIVNLYNGLQHLWHILRVFSELVCVCVCECVCVSDGSGMFGGGTRLVTWDLPIYYTVYCACV